MLVVLNDKFTHTAPEVDNEQNGHSARPVQTGRAISRDDLFGFLENRRGKIDGVVVTGGEPLLQPDLPEFLQQIRALGYKIKLDTNGTNARVLRELWQQNLIDYLAMDIKAPFHKYDLVTGVQPDIDQIKASISLVMAGSVPYEFRTTVVPELHKRADIKSIGEQIKGAALWYLQKFSSHAPLVNADFENMTPYGDAEMQAMRRIALRYVKNCQVR